MRFGRGLVPAVLLVAGFVLIGCGSDDPDAQQAHVGSSSECVFLVTVDGRKYTGWSLPDDSRVALDGPAIKGVIDNCEDVFTESGPAQEVLHPEPAEFRRIAGVPAEMAVFSTSFPDKRMIFVAYPLTFHNSSDAPPELFDLLNPIASDKF